MAYLSLTDTLAAILDTLITEGDLDQDKNIALLECLQTKLISPISLRIVHKFLPDGHDLRTLLKGSKLVFNQCTTTTQLPVRVSLISIITTCIYFNTYV